MIEKGKELWLANSDNSHHKQKRNDSINIISSCNLHAQGNVLTSNDKKCTNK